MIRFACPGCQKQFSVTDDKAGKTGKCPECGSQFMIPMPEGVAPPSASAAMPPPAAMGTGPANDFSFGGDDEPTPKKRSRGKPEGDEDDDETPPSPSRRKKKMADTYDEDEYEDARPKKSAEPGKGMAIAAGVVHFVFALLMLACGICNSALGGVGTAMGDTGEQASSRIKADPKTKFDKDAQKAADAASKLGTVGKILLAVGICYILTALGLSIPAGVGCVMRKPFGKYLSFAAGPVALLLRLGSDAASLFILGSDALGAGQIAGMCFAIILLVAYPGFTIFAAMKGIPSGHPSRGKKLGKKAITDDDQDEEDDQDEDDRPAKKRRRNDDDE